MGTPRTVQRDACWCVRLPLQVCDSAPPVHSTELRAAEWLDPVLDHFKDPQAWAQVLRGQEDFHRHRAQTRRQQARIQQAYSGCGLQDAGGPVVVGGAGQREDRSPAVSLDARRQVRGRRQDIQQERDGAERLCRPAEESCCLLRRVVQNV